MKHIMQLFGGWFSVNSAIPSNVRCYGHNLDGSECKLIVDRSQAIRMYGHYFCSQDHADRIRAGMIW
jgi:hypothetical protein